LEGNKGKGVSRWGGEFPESKINFKMEPGDFASLPLKKQEPKLVGRQGEGLKKRKSWKFGISKKTTKKNRDNANRNRT